MRNDTKYLKQKLCNIPALNGYAAILNLNPKLCYFMYDKMVFFFF